MRIILPLLLCLALVTAEERQPTPAESLQIVATVCAEVPLKLKDQQAVQAALQVLAKAIEPKSAIPEHAIAPVEPPKEKP